MARAAAKGSKRARQDAREQQRAAKSGRHRRQLNTAEQGLFFSRIRRQAKWAYVVLAFLFASTFAVLGVGSGQGGLDQIFNNIFGGSGGSSISSLEKQVQQHPKQAKAWHDLALAYGSKKRTDSAINALRTYTTLRPKDPAGFAQLAQFQLGQAGALAIDWQSAQALASGWQSSTYQPFTPSGKLGQGLGGTDPATTALQSRASEVQTAASSAQAVARGAYQQALGTLQRVAKLEPRSADPQIRIAGAADTALQGLQDTTFIKPEIDAYARLVKLDPEKAAQYRQRIKQLKPYLPKPSG